MRNIWAYCCCKRPIRQIFDWEAEKNRGELSMYMIEDAHEAIIEKEVFEAVQKKKRWSTSCK